MIKKTDGLQLIYLNFTSKHNTYIFGLLLHCWTAKGVEGGYGYDLGCMVYDSLNQFSILTDNRICEILALMGCTLFDKHYKTSRCYTFLGCSDNLECTIQLSVEFRDNFFDIIYSCLWSFCANWDLINLLYGFFFFYKFRF